MCDNWKLKPNFVENLQWQFSDFSNLKTILNKKLCEKLKTEPNFAWQIKFAWHLKTENQTLWINVALIFSVRENIILHLTAVCINGWACGKSSLAQLFNLKFFLFYHKLFQSLSFLRCFLQRYTTMRYNVLRLELMASQSTKPLQI